VGIPVSADTGIPVPGSYQQVRAGSATYFTDTVRYGYDAIGTGTVGIPAGLGEFWGQLLGINLSNSHVMPCICESFNSV